MTAKPSGDGRRAMSAVRWVGEDGEELPPSHPVFQQWWRDVNREAVARRTQFPVLLASLLGLGTGEIPPQVEANGSSLNLFSVVFGPPGAGKTKGFREARKLLPPPPEIYAPGGLNARPTSGAGIKELFLERVKTASGGFRLERNKYPSALIRIDEGEGFEKLNLRDANDVMADLRSGWMGEDLVTSGAAEKTKRNVAAGGYRLCALIFAQPEISLGSVKDRLTGTQQRFLAFPCWDKTGGEALAARWVEGMPPPPQPQGNIFPEAEQLTAAPGELWKASRWEDEPRRQIPIAAAVMAELEKFQDGLEAALRLEAGGGGIPAHAVPEMRALAETTVGSPEYRRIDHGEHTMLLRLRVAVPCAYFRLGRSVPRLLKEGVGEEDWRLSYSVMACSAHTWREHDRIAAEVGRAERAAAMRDTGQRAAVESDAVQENAIRRVDARIRGVVRSAYDKTEEGPITMGDLWRSLSGRVRRNLMMDLEADTETVQNCLMEALADEGFGVRAIAKGSYEIVPPSEE